MLGDYIVRSLSASGISADAPIAWFLAWVFASPLNILLSTFIIVVIISLLIDSLNKKENGKIETQPAVHLEVDGHGKVAGHDIVETHHHYSEEKRKTISSPNINIEISYFVLAETIEEKRAEHQTHRPIKTRRLPYSIKNESDTGIKDCRIKMISLVLRDSPNNYYSNTTNLSIEDSSIKWKNSDKERIDLGIGSVEPIILAKIPDYNAIPIFHFVVFGDDRKSLSEKVPRVFEGTWDVGVQVEGKVENNGIATDLAPMRFIISFRFENFSLIPLEVKQHERQNN